MESDCKRRGAIRNGPYFSIVIAVRNRREVIGRCLKSILSQGFDDIEVIAVDDASTDDTTAVIESFCDPRVHLIVESQNSGMWGSRIVGFKRARGRWVIILDSDDELTSGALQWFYERTNSAQADVGIVGASYRDDDGNIHPWPPFPDGPFGLTEAIEWRDSAVRFDYLHAFRKELLEQEELPPPMGQANFFDLEVFEHWRKDISGAICGLIHTDASDRLSGKGKKANVELFILKARQTAEANERLLREYGGRLKREAPRFRGRVRRMAGLTHMVAGHRGRGARRLLAYLVRKPTDVKAWGLLVFGLIGPRTLIWARRHMT